MKATLAAIADGASVGAGDKLNVQGVFDTIFADTFPAVHARMVVVVRLQLEPADAAREYTCECGSWTARDGASSSRPPGRTSATCFVHGGPVDTQEPEQALFWIHPEHPHLHMTVPIGGPLSRFVVDYAAHLIRSLQDSEAA